MKGQYYFKRLSIKLFNWEYWPFHVVYLPVYVYWFWLFLKSRSFFFFSTSNPSIRNAGFLMESKKEIYDLIPPEYYPATILVEPGTTIDQVQAMLQQQGMQLPLVGKPDIGMKGKQVKVLATMDDVNAYLLASRVAFLLQAFVDYPNEVGIFYYRMPGATKGKVSGIVGKEFLTLVGDGRSTMEQLILANDRFLLQLDTLQKTYGDTLQQVPEANALCTLVPYGNHCRGAKFIDLTNRLDEQMESAIDALCKRVPGFYYGRLDIKYASWEALRQGRELAIIELNGAGSEPTHMYDPAHNVFFAWKEIIRHLDILYRISVANKQQLNLSYMTLGEGIAMLKANSAHVRLIS